MMTKKKRTILIVPFCALFLIAAGVTFLSLNWDYLFNATSTAHAPISFPDDTVSARAEIKTLSMDDKIWETIRMDFSDIKSLKELFKLEEWANSYQYNKELKLERWTFSVCYQLEDGSTVERSYQKCEWDEVIAEFVKSHEENVTEMREFGS